MTLQQCQECKSLSDTLYAKLLEAQKGEEPEEGCESIAMWLESAQDTLSEVIFDLARCLELLEAPA